MMSTNAEANFLGFHFIFLEEQYKATGEWWNEVMEYLHLNDLGDVWYLWLKFVSHTYMSLSLDSSHVAE